MLGNGSFAAQDLPDNAVEMRVKGITMDPYGKTVFLLVGIVGAGAWYVMRGRLAAAAATLTTAILDNPDGYGRVIRQTDGSFQAIVEQPPEALP